MYTDPFKEDTDKFKNLLNRDTSKGLVEEAQVVESDEVLSKGTVQGLPPAVFKAVKDQSNRIQIDENKKKQVAEVFNKLFADLNQKYGLSVTLDFNSFTNNLDYLIEPKNKKAAEYYLSEAYGMYRIALYQQYLQAISLLSSQILDPSYILSESMTYDQKLDTLERLYGFMSTMNDIYEKVNIPDTSMKLEKLSEDQRPNYRLDDPNIKKFMEDTFKQVKK